MPKLLTPRQYEKPLEDINELRPLQLDDEVKQHIDIAVCNKLPVSTKKSITGVLTKGTQQGALLEHLKKDYTSRQAVSVTIYAFAPENKITFTQKVFFVLCVITSSGSLNTLYWTDPTYTDIIKRLDVALPTYIEFIGTDLYITASFYNSTTAQLVFYGFY